MKFKLIKIVTIFLIMLLALFFYEYDMVVLFYISILIPFYFIYKIIFNRRKYYLALLSFVVPVSTITIFGIRFRDAFNEDERPTILFQNDYNKIYFLYILSFIVLITIVINELDQFKKKS
jgi:hypothetical protein